MKSCLSLDDITADPGLLSPWLQSFLSESVLERLDPLARRGVAQLAAWAEQPPLSLDARRANQVVLHSADRPNVIASRPCSREFGSLIFGASATAVHR